MEKNFQTMNSKRLWDSMKIATNMKLTEKSLHVTDELAKTNELNYFYKRFDNYDFSAECDMVLDSIATDDADRLEIDLKSITKFFKQVNATKATGPDGISPFLIRTCADKLTSAWCPFSSGPCTLTLCQLYGKRQLPLFPKNLVHRRIILDLLL